MLLPESDFIVVVAVGVPCGVGLHTSWNIGTRGCGAVLGLEGANVLGPIAAGVATGAACSGVPSPSRSGVGVDRECMAFRSISAVSASAPASAIAAGSGSRAKVRGRPLGERRAQKGQPTEIDQFSIRTAPRRQSMGKIAGRAAVLIESL